MRPKRPCKATDASIFHKHFKKYATSIKVVHDHRAKCGHILIILHEHVQIAGNRYKVIQGRTVKECLQKLSEIAPF